jgi:hypothetical protein
MDDIRRPEDLPLLADAIPAKAKLAELAGVSSSPRSQGSSSNGSLPGQNRATYETVPSSAVSGP